MRTHPSRNPSMGWVPEENVISHENNFNGFEGFSSASLSIRSLSAGFEERTMQHSHPVVTQDVFADYQRLHTLSDSEGCLLYASVGGNRAVM